MSDKNQGQIAGIYGAGLTIDVPGKPGTTFGSLHSETASPYGLKGGGDLREDLGRAFVLQ